MTKSCVLIYNSDDLASECDINPNDQSFSDFLKEFPMLDGPGVLTTRRTKRDLFLYTDGHLIAKRGRPGSRRAGKWISLVAGLEVVSDPAGNFLIGPEEGLEDLEASLAITNH